MTATPASPFNWKIPAGRALEVALNRALALDRDSGDALRTLDGRCITLSLQASASPSATGRQSPLALQMRVDDAQLRVGPVEAGGEPDLSIRSTLGGLIAQLPMFRHNDAPPVGKLHVSGDAELARRLQRLAERFDPDWQQPFAAVFGDVLGVQIANAVAGGLKQARIAGRNLAESAAEFVTEESRDVVPRAELDAFHDDVDALRDDVERIAAKIAHLQARTGDVA